MKKENLSAQLNKVSEELAPSSQSQIRVWNKIDASLSKGVQNESKSSALFDFFSKRRFLVPFLIAPVCFLVISLPLIINGNGRLNLADDLRGQPESTVSDKKPGETDYFYKGNTGGKVLQPSVRRESDQNGVIVDNDTKEEDRAKEKTGTISIEVTDFDAKFQEINKILVEFEGYSLESKIYDNYDQKSANIKVKVPVDKFDEFTGKLRELSYEVISEDISIVDKQDEVSSYEKQIAEIDKKLLQKGLSESEIVQLKLQKVNLQTQLTNLQNTTSYATLQIRIDEHITPGERVSTVINDVSLSLVEVAAFWAQVVIWISVPALFFSPILIPLYLARKKLGRKLRKSK